ncbi:MAG: 3-phosphoshikimate 1-carboxyvinyltransferase [Oscillospiraceae bacterium]|jgi:3-phosphoshikimate 1-carboxyvinyltransferase|nr:3-phosphoshikimate 1-carboxyvinyltransferase [Oscillospiraceae bacterium]
MELRKVGGIPSGDIRLPPSKSIMHRIIIAEFLSGRRDFTEYAGISDDISATAACVTALSRGGAQITLNCGESGSTLRFVLPLAAALGVNAKFTGSAGLLSRPIAALSGALTENGAEIKLSPDCILLSGRLRPGKYVLPGDESSQYFTGLLFALPLLDASSEIVSAGEVQSKPYIDITLDIMSRYGVNAMETANGYAADPQTYIAPMEKISAESDWSQAAFFLCASALGAKCTIHGLRTDSLQGDRAVLDILRRSGATVSELNGGITLTAERLNAVSFDASDIPDIVPPLAAALCVADGESVISGCSRLRHKESDRLKTVSEALSALGANIKISGDTLIIRGKPELSGGQANAAGDHRIAMMCAVASVKANGDVFIGGADCVSKSYPNFWSDWEGTEK